MSAVRFSIITATFNRAAMLREAIESVMTQRRSDLEHLIIDGGSTDGTREMLVQWPQLRVVSEPDRGVYDAFNKGITLARGEIVHFLNSDDLLMPGTLDAVDRAFADDAVEVVSGTFDFFERGPDGGERVLRRVENVDELAFSLRQMLRGVPALNARFFRRRFLGKIGLFDLDYRVASDRDFLVRAALLEPRAATVVPELVYRYRSHDGSLTVHDTARNAVLIRGEHVDLAEKNLARSLALANRTELLALHRRESATLAIDALVKGDWSGARKWAQRGCAVSAGWPLAALARLGGWLLGRGTRYTLARGEAAPR